MNIIQLIKNTIGNRKRLWTENAEGIQDYNVRMLPRLLVISSVLMAVPLLICIIQEQLRKCLPGYLSVVLVCALMALLFRSPKMKKYSLAGMYIMFTVVYGLTLYLSLVCYPDRIAASMLSFFCVMPLLFIDKPMRQNSVEIAFYLIHIVLSYKIKGPEIADMDMINCLVSAILGMLCGSTVSDIQIDALEARRQLTIEKETDVLTGLKNRRKLFDTIADMETHENGKPGGILMLDIDHFKEINDLKGHAMGDECLRQFGRLLTEFECGHSVTFYRYGGEEFVGLVFGGCENDMLCMAEGLRETVFCSEPGGMRLTISVGTAWRGGSESDSLEKWIDRADKAAYAAKSIGRNSVVRYTAELET